MDKPYTVRSVETEHGEVFFMLPNSLKLGSYHDVLMNEKSWCIQRIVEAQEEQKKLIESNQNNSQEGE
jgi:anthranilate/para-aminobenzoate synthase component II